MPAVLGPSFWNKLSSISQSLGMSSEDLLAVMYFESGIDPAIVNHTSHATGLIQFMPDTLKGLGFNGSYEDFKGANAETQLDYVEKYIRNQMKYNGRPFKSATQYYIANFWPVALRSVGVINQDPNTPIVERDPKVKKYPGVSLEQEREAYKENQVLDADKDGVITYGDLDKIMSGVKSSSGFKYALSQLENGKEYIAGKNHTTKQQIEEKSEEKSTDFLSRINKFLDNFLTAVVAQQKQDRLQKKAEFKKHLSYNVMTIKINSQDMINSIEFARILCLALEEEALAEKSTIHNQDSIIEVNCYIYGPHKICIGAVTQLSKSLAEVFKEATKKIGGVEVDVEVIPDKITNYPVLDMKLAQSSYRRFRYKFINRK